MQLIDFIICDDIRFEIGNKHTLVGLYGDINLPYQKGAGKPASIMIKLGIFIRCMFDNKAEKPDAFILEFMHSNKGAMTPIKGPLTIQNGIKYLNLAFVNNFNMPGEGTIQFKLSFMKSGRTLCELVPAYHFIVNLVETEQSA